MTTARQKPFTAADADEFQQAAMAAIYDCADEARIDYPAAVTIVMDGILADMIRGGDDLCRSYIEATLDQAIAPEGSDAERTATAARCDTGERLIQAMRDADEAEWETTVYPGGAGRLQ